MKKALLALALLTSLSSFAQPQSDRSEACSPVAGDALTIIYVLREKLRTPEELLASLPASITSEDRAQIQRMIGMALASTEGDNLDFAVSVLNMCIQGILNPYTSTY